jgi:hypothetical protein
MNGALTHAFGPSIGLSLKGDLDYKVLIINALE